jgi:hypothetical protein
VKRLGIALGVLVVVAGAVAFGLWRYRIAHAPPPPPTEAEIKALQARRDEIQKAIADHVVASGEKSLAKAPRAGVMIGIPTGLTRSVAGQLVSGLFKDMTLRLQNIKVHKEGQVKAKMLFKKKQVGAFVLDVNIKEVEGRLRPGPPDLRFSNRRVAFALPVALASGEGRAELRFRWDSKGMAANMVCGDLDVTKEVTGSVIPTDYLLSGAFGVSNEGGTLTLTPDFPDLAVRITVKPSDQAWAVVDEVVKEQRAGCEVALGKVNIKEKLSEIIGRGFNVKIPKKLQRPIRLPAGISQSMEVQGIRLALDVKPTGVLLSQERIWYGAELELEATKAQPKKPPAAKAPAKAAGP